jgi:rRNA-processing protein EBP2
VPFSRPADYFAEMVKSEEQMGKVRQKMVDEAARKKASADARRQRDLKKFGKAVQVAKLQERDKAKRDTLEKINTLKRSESLTISLHIVYANSFYRTAGCGSERE